MFTSIRTPLLLSLLLALTGGCELAGVDGRRGNLDPRQPPLDAGLVDPPGEPICETYERLASPLDECEAQPSVTEGFRAPAPGELIVRGGGYTLGDGAVPLESWHEEDCASSYIQVELQGGEPFDPGADSCRHLIGTLRYEDGRVIRTDLGAADIFADVEERVLEIDSAGPGEAVLEIWLGEFSDQILFSADVVIEDHCAHLCALDVTPDEACGRFAPQRECALAGEGGATSLDVEWELGVYTDAGDDLRDSAPGVMLASLPIVSTDCGERVALEFARGSVDAQFACATVYATLTYQDGRHVEADLGTLDFGSPTEDTPLLTLPVDGAGQARLELSFEDGDYAIGMVADVTIAPGR